LISTATNRPNYALDFLPQFCNGRRMSKRTTATAQNGKGSRRRPENTEAVRKNWPFKDKGISAESTSFRNPVCSNKKGVINNG
jgi:hypothetical protein